VAEIDWSEYDRKGYKPDDVTCRCGCGFESHTRATMVDGGFTIVTRVPCPSCGATRDMRGVRSKPERWST
jgi:hypothetical protein